MKRLLLFLLLAQSVLLVAAQQLRNPVIPGFHPDPSVCRVGDDFYLVNSSFHYFPGVPIFHSKDLVNWEQIGNVLDRESQLPLEGATSWLGIYAPTIRYHEGTYYMITTNVGKRGNFLVTAKNPAGPWSEPVWLEQGGIDPSLYFEDGKCYMVSNPDNTIVLCEIDPVTGKQLTQGRPLWQGTGGRWPEGPHIYKKDGYYYLLISEGGTELAHKLTIARSRNIYGPYESNPSNPILTNCSRDGQSMQIQGTGHGDFVQAQDGSWWMVFLAYRNFGGSYHHIGRETCLVPVEWKAGEWPVVGGGRAVDTLMTVKTLPAVPVKKPASRTLFNKGIQLGPEWVYLQNPIMANYQLTEGKLRLVSHGTLAENRQPTFLGRRQESPNIQVETEVTLHHPIEDKYGLVVYQINDGYLMFYATSHDINVEYRLKSVDGILASEDWSLADIPERVRLRITSNGERYYFSYACNDETSYTPLADIECSLVSTEVVGGFTGVTIGMFTEYFFNNSSATAYGDFSYFDYIER
jgi:alpha-N-arabinofuranosidase